MEYEQTQQNEPAHRLARRSLLAAGLGGAAVTVAPLLQRAVSASTPPGSSAPESTTTTAPLRPTADDVVLLAAAQSLELAARDLYAMAVATKPGDATLAAVLATIHDDHMAYAQEMAGLLGRDAPGTADAALVDQLKAAFSGSDSKAMLAAAATLEADLAQTHCEAIGQLKAVSGARVLASIAVVEGRHGTVLADLGKTKDLDELLSPAATKLTVKG